MNSVQINILLIISAIILCVLQYRNVFVMAVLRKAGKLQLNLSIKYINNIPKNINNFQEMLNKSDLFMERFDKLPSQLLMIFLFHKWTYKQLIGTYEEDLQKIYEENMKNV